MGWFKGRVVSDTAAANSIIPIVSGATIGATRALKANAQGTATITTANGEVLAGFQLEQGWNPVSVVAVTLDGTLAAGSLFACY